MTMITPSYLGETIEYSSLHACRSTLEDPTLLLVVVPMLGGLAAGLLVRYVSPESGGHGVGEVLEAIVVPARRIPGRVAFWKAMASGLVIGSGGSAGREGPVVQMGASVANYLGSRMGLRREDVSLLLIAGGGAGIAASFNAPFAGMAFALEILLGDLGPRSLAPIVLAAVTATLTGRALIGAGGEVGAVSYEIKSPLEVGVYALLGLFAGLCAILYIKSIHGTEAVFEGRAEGRLAPLSRLLHRLPAPLRPMLGGLLVGGLGLLVPRALGNGYESMNAALAGTLGATTLLVVLLAKIATSGLTLGSGAPGGSFFPAVFMGAMLGGAFGVVGHRLAPDLIAGSGPYAAVGMGAVVAGATLAPLTGIVMLFEMTRTYSIVIPLMVACGLATFLVQWRVGGSIYTLKLRKKGLRRLGERVEILSTLKVRDAMLGAPPTVAPGTTLRAVIRLFSEAGTDAFAVVAEGGKLVGLLEWGDLRQAVSEPALFDLAVAAEMCQSPPPSVTMEQPLDEALRSVMAQGGANALVTEEGKLVGLLSRRAILAAYDRAIRPDAALATPSEPLPPAGAPSALPAKPEPASAGPASKEPAAGPASGPPR